MATTADWKQGAFRGKLKEAKMSKLDKRNIAFENTELNNLFVGFQSLQSELESKNKALQSELESKNKEEYKIFLDKYIQNLNKLYESNRKVANHFNPIKLFKVKFDEITHSNILSWIFDPYGSHNQGDLFFKYSLKHFNYSIKYDPRNYKVIKEFRGYESIVDIVIYSKDFVFFIENKTLSSEGLDQTNREYRDLRRFSKKMSIKKDSNFSIFLSPKGSKPLNKNFKPITYRSLSIAFEESLEEIEAPYVGYFIKSWLNILNSI